ncbi:inositol monophosphatase family protein [Agromyces aerolatus]|uniref:inositol monophosphatase family protein n=1 Tax=Agromyces sp. LY-1074 TaxID=3074080 RepID=UPI0028665E0B|nr:MULTISPECIES: inositol monophosphatase family protein [unclassified Agromyces]MDR5701385.1 inositol monophosphatase family protein [Agromyces sp. LY-1074]MDR5706826.1 inositol monophosphatase family protein [Agromyces sp. LY-1358]
MTIADASVPSPADLLVLARDIAVSAGSFALEARRAGVEVAATKSTPTDIVTAVDRDTESFIRRLILEARPDDGILGEEEATHIGTSGLDWIVDPIDGTVNFLYGIPSWAVSIAVVSESSEPGSWTALAGVVVNPVTGELFEASAGGGARLGGRELRTVDEVALGQALVGTGFSYAAERRGEQAEVLTRLLPRVRDLRRMGAASLDLCSVAAGRLDAFYEVGLNPWDHAAGALIAREAGAVITGPGGGRESHEFLVAAVPGLHEDLVAALREAGAPA